MDINMPVMDGYMAAMEIRKELSRVQTKIIAASAYHSSVVDEKAKECGMDHTMAKPIDQQELEQIVETFRINHLSNLLP